MVNGLVVSHLPTLYPSAPATMAEVNLDVKLQQIHFLNGPFPFSFIYIFLFSVQFTENIQYYFFLWLDSNCGPLESEATTQPTETQPLHLQQIHLYV